MFTLFRLIMSRKIISERHYFSVSEKHEMIKLFLSGKSRMEVWYQYRGKHDDHGALRRWMREFGYSDASAVICEKNITFASSSDVSEMCAPVSGKNLLQLEEELAKLKKDLADAQMKAEAFSTMIDIAERDLKISIRKKFNTKP